MKEESEVGDAPRDFAEDVLDELLGRTDVAASIQAPIQVAVATLGGFDRRRQRSGRFSDDQHRFFADA